MPQAWLSSIRRQSLATDARRQSLATDAALKATARPWRLSAAGEFEWSPLALLGRLWPPRSEGPQLAGYSSEMRRLPEGKATALNEYAW